MMRLCWIFVAGSLVATLPAHAQDTAPVTVGGVTVSTSLRTRIESWDWFDTTDAGKYTYSGSIFRLALSRSRTRVAWHFEIAAPFIVGLPSDAMRTGSIGALGLGANYYAANDNHKTSGALFIKQAFVTLPSLGGVTGQSLRVGRMEFADGAEVIPKHATLAALKRDRIGQRLIGSFAFTHVGRSFDGVRYGLDRGPLNVTAFAARPTRGVFDVDGWGELKVNVFYAAVTRQVGRADAPGEWRLFGLGYQDYRQVEHIDVGTVGGHALHAFSTRAGTIDLLFWGAAQFGSWRHLAHRAGAVAIEGGWQPRALPRLAPWLRAGFNFGSGDGRADDGVHGTFFQVLPTPRVYARFPFFNMMNASDLFGSASLRPSKSLTARVDVHALRLASSQDLWYSGGGAFQNATFGFAGRNPSGQKGLARFIDGSLDCVINRHLSVNAYYGHAFGGHVPESIYASSTSARFVFLEALIRF